MEKNDELVSTLNTLNSELKRLTKINYKNNSYRHTFFMGLLSGFAWVIGATIVVAIFVYILTQLSHIDLLRPLIEKIIEIVNSNNSVKLSLGT